MKFKRKLMVCMATEPLWGGGDGNCQPSGFNN